MKLILNSYKNKIKINIKVLRKMKNSNIWIKILETIKLKYGTFIQKRSTSIIYIIHILYMKI